MSDQDDLLKSTQKHLNKGEKLVSNPQYAPILRSHGYRFDPEFSTTHTHNNIDIWMHPDGHEVTIHPEHGWHHIDSQTDEAIDGDSVESLDRHLTGFHDNIRKWGLRESEDDILNQARHRIVDKGDWQDPKQAAMMTVIAKHPNVEPHTLHEIVMKSNKYQKYQANADGLRSHIAANPKTRLETLWHLRADDNPDTRLAVARHANADSKLLRRMALDYNKMVVFAAKQNPNLK